MPHCHKQGMGNQKENNGKTCNMVEMGHAIHAKGLFQPFDSSDQQQLEKNSKDGQQSCQPSVCKVLSDCRSGKLISHRVIDMIRKPETDCYQELSRKKEHQSNFFH
jgi:hypothetical protein